MEQTTEFQLMEYNPVYSCVFRKTKEKYGGFSNMSAGYPLLVNGIQIRTSEALYQACRFPDYPDIQKLILGQASPMLAKRIMYPYRRDFSRENWDELKVEIMSWCLKVKLIQNHYNFGRLLDSTGQMSIVEDSHKDQFWGTVRNKNNNGLLVGKNVLGRLLEELRLFYRENRENIHSLTVPPLEIPKFKLLGEEIGIISRVNR